MTLPIVVFSAESLQRKPHQGEQRTNEWGELVEWCRAPIVLEDKADGGGFTIARLRDGVRRKTHVEGVPAVGFDHDAGLVTIEAAHEALVTRRHILYTTHSSTHDAPRWRAIIPFDREATLEEFERLYPVLGMQLSAVGIALDASAKDATRLWYVPAIKPDARFDFRDREGAPLVVDRLLNLAARFEARRDEERRRRPAPPEPTSPTRFDAYVRGAIESAASSIANGVEGERHYLVCKEAFSLARFGLTEAEISASLMPSAIHSMGEQRRAEVEKAIHDAVVAQAMRSTR